MNNGQKKPVEVITMPAGKQTKFETGDAEIIFFTRGCVCISTTRENRTVKKGQFILLPPCNRLLVQPQGDVAITATVIRMEHGLRLCNNYTINSLYRPDEHEMTKHIALDVHVKIKEYLDHFVECVNAGMACPDYTGIKIRELLILIRMLYSREELAGFFAPLLSSDTAFTGFVLKNYRNAKNATELAMLANLSMSAFKKKFSQVFGMPAQDWLMEQKEKDVLYELLHSDKSLKEITHEYHFATTSHLNYFCIKRLKMTPGRIRKGDGGNNNENNVIRQNVNPRYSYNKNVPI